jgi:hypothetical protein
MDELRDGLLRVERERSRGKQPHGKHTSDQPNGARCAPLMCSRDVRCNRGFEQLQLHSERSNRSPSHIPLTGCADQFLLLRLNRYIPRAITKELQSGNGSYAFNASSREIAGIFGSRLRSEALRCCPHDPPEPFVSRISIDTRMPYHQDVKALQLRWRTNNAQMRVAFHD